MVEHQLPKLSVVGSIPIARSTVNRLHIRRLGCLARVGRNVFPGPFPVAGGLTLLAGRRGDLDMMARLRANAARVTDARLLTNRTAAFSGRAALVFSGLHHVVLLNFI